MIRIDSEKDIQGAFRPIDQDSLELPAGLRYPLLLVNYMAWSDEANLKTFMVFAEPGSNKLLGIAFRRDQSAGAQTSHICDWCHACGSSREIGMLTASVSERKRVGVHLCLDLSCKQKAEESLSGNPRAKVRTLMQKASRFARQNLF